MDDSRFPLPRLRGHRFRGNDKKVGMTRRRVNDREGVWTSKIRNGYKDKEEWQ